MKQSLFHGKQETLSNSHNSQERGKKHILFFDHLDWLKNVCMDCCTALQFLLIRIKGERDIFICKKNILFLCFLLLSGD